jgi:acetylornithine deacetylase/succinyl-diaminopimelate desuccinylase-like protein
MKIPAFFGMAVVLLALSPNAPAKDSALDRLKAYIEVDTVNPPGNETRGVEFFSRILDDTGISYETAESAPGRGNIWARLEGGGEPGLLLLHHIDVVPATASEWDTDPLQAVVKDGYLFGRGTLDTKSLGILHLEAFLALQRSGLRLERDVIFMATADEEAGGMFGAGWLVENRPEIFEDVGYLLNEGGSGVESGDQKWFQVELAQKRPYWLRLTATDEPGHGSRPLPTSATTRLIQALNRIYENPFEPRIVAPVRQMFEAVSLQAAADWQAPLKDIDSALLDPVFLKRFQAEKPHLHALIRNTCSITMLKGSGKINVVSPIASAELDCRILPDQSAEEFLNDIRSRVDDDYIQIEEIMLFGAAQSSADTKLFRLLQDVNKKHYPTAGMVPAVSTGFTDSHFFRDIGITSYGYSPLVVPEEFFQGTHGNNERIGIETFHQGVEMMTEIVRNFATSGSIQ